MRLVPLKATALALFLAHPTPALAHGDQVLVAMAMFPWLIVSLIFLFWRVTGSGERRATWATAVAVLGSSAVLFLVNGTVCLTLWWCNDTGWWLLILAQFAVPSFLWIGLWWRSRHPAAMRK